MKDHISICICTFRRNQMLENLLRKLNLQETDECFDFSAVVVDNDDTGAARELVMSLKSEIKMEMVYGIEPERTIAAARNHALRLATGNFISIIDDDEFPPPRWLITMYQAIQTFDVDGSLGPVHPFFRQKPPAWLLKGRFCERPVYRTGTILDWTQTRTGNVLLKKDVFDKFKIQFDLRWKTSGSDREFFRQAMRIGYRFVAVAEAPVYENVPPERWTRRYYLRRSLVHGFNSTKKSGDERSGVKRLIMSLKSLAALLVYALALPFCACFGNHFLVNCLERGGYHLSRTLAIMGIELVKKRDF